MRLPKLSARLSMTAALIPPGFAVADIGTDHAYLPVFLVQQGIAPHAIAADIDTGPLQNAAKSIERAGLQEKIQLRQSNGFGRFAAKDASVWVLAGMGGTLMARLLDVTPWLQMPGTTIVAQPMCRAHELRAWLIAHGFLIEQEAACRDAGRVYIALRALYDGQLRNYPPGYTYYGELIHSGDPIVRTFLARELNLLRVRVEAPGESADLEEAYHDFCARYL